MRLAGLLSWYDESESWLATAVAGMARVCDLIIACDGAYALYPSARTRSHPAQAEAIMGAAEAADVECLIHRPKDLYFGNEVEKRNQTLDFARALLTEGEDWVAVFDADMHILKCSRADVRHELEQTEHHVATYTFLDGKDLLGVTDLAGYVATHDIDYEWTSRERLIYRLLPGLLYGPLHWAVSGLVDGERRWLRGPIDADDILPETHLNANLACYHRTSHRALVRQQQAAIYYDRREQAEIETMTSADVAAA